MKRLFILMTCFVLAACASSSKPIALRPQTDVSYQLIGNKQPIIIKVIDARPNLQEALSGSYAPRSADITNVVTKEITAALKNYGFTVEPYLANAPRKLEVQVLSLDYASNTNVFQGSMSANASLKVIAQNASKQVYDKTYQATMRKGVMVTPSYAQSNEQVNAVVSNVLNQLLNDRNIFYFLAS